MRKIESQMVAAIYKNKNWCSGNTMVKTDDANISRVFLHGNHIATIAADMTEAEPLVVVDRQRRIRVLVPNALGDVLTTYPLQLAPKALDDLRDRARLESF